MTPHQHRRTSSSTTIVLSVALGGILAGAACALYFEARTSALETAVTRFTDGDAAAQTKAVALSEQALGQPLTRTPRVLLSASALTAETARRARDPARRTALSRASEDLAREAAAWPGYKAQALLQVGYAAAIRDDERTALDAIARSYDAAGYIRFSGAWRAAYVAQAWPRAGARLRRGALEETMWLGGIDPPLALAIEAAYADPAASLALSLRKARAVSAAGR